MTHVARILKISRSSLYRWLENSSLKEKPRKGKPASFKSTTELKNLLIDNPSLSGMQLALHFNVSPNVIYYHLKKLGLSYKKKRSSYKETVLKKIISVELS